jgi:uncharacterized protein with NAD-binding domain and iron-sulfur cluster
VKQRIAILGGGMGSLVTAWELTSLPDWQDRYEIVVYQQGWRLGGKGASGRGLHERIEEHGLHVLFGCYENACRIMESAWAEVPLEAGEPRRDFFEDMLAPQREIIMYEKIQGRHRPWTLDIVPRQGRPGDNRPVQLDPFRALLQLIAWLRETAKDSKRDRDTIVRMLAAIDEAERGVDALAAQAGIGLTSVGVPPVVGEIDGQITEVMTLAQGSPLSDTMGRRAGILINLYGATFKGLLASGVWLSGWDWFDGSLDKDLRPWLHDHGAQQETLDSPVVQAAYDCVFTPTAMSAGAMLHCGFRIAMFKGNVLYKMRGGMGDVIFAPLYRVLLERGVRFEFFHRVEALHRSADGNRIESITVDRQANVKQPPYRPLVPLAQPGSGDLYCWPNEPDWSQLDLPGSKRPDFEDWWGNWRGTEITLRRVDPAVQAGPDEFHSVVLGLSVGIFPDVCRDLLAGNAKPRFREMVAALAPHSTTQTQAFQLWLLRSLPDLEWQHNDGSTVIPYEEPFDTWADMTHLVREERFPDGDVRAVTYHCSSMDDDAPPPHRPAPGYVASQNARVRENSVQWIADNLPRVWPAAVDGQGKFDWNVLWTGDAHKTGVARFDEQFWIATKSPSDRYVWPLAGTMGKRLRAHESEYENLILAGDWTKNAFSVGCLEAATMSGIAAARAIDPGVRKAVNDWLPDPRDKGFGLAAAGPGREYIVRDAEMMTPPPVTIDVKQSWFLVPASWGALNKLCNDQLNLAPGRRFRPLGPFVVVYCADMNNDTEYGSIPELDFGVWVPVVGFDVRAGVPIPTTIANYTPYIWVSNSPAAIGGRSLFGFPKHVATLCMPKPPWGNPPVFTVDGWATVHQRGASEVLRLMDIRPVGSGPAPTMVPEAWASSTDVLAALEPVVEPLLKGTRDLALPTWRDVLALFDGQVGGPVVFLKQLPKADTSLEACYQAILEGVIAITQWRGSGSIRGRFEMELFEGFSHHLVETLGLRTKSSRTDSAGRTFHTVPILTQGWADFVAKVGSARVVWEVGP